MKNLGRELRGRRRGRLDQHLPRHHARWPIQEHDGVHRRHGQEEQRADRVFQVLRQVLRVLHQVLLRLPAVVFLVFHGLVRRVSRPSPSDRKLHHERPKHDSESMRQRSSKSL